MEYPKCNKDKCFGNKDGECRILRNTEFKNTCPFFKTAEQIKKANKKTRKD